MPNDHLRQIIAYEFETHVQAELIKDLRKLVVDATMHAVAIGNMPEKLRDQAIGRASGLYEALKLAEETYTQMLESD